MSALDELNESYGVADRISFETGNGGLVRATLRTARAEAHVYLHGAHVTHFAKTGEPPVLFMSNQSLFQVGKPIRGGVPICFPWFGPKAGDKDAPMHGFARTAAWAVNSSDATGPAETRLTLILRATPESQKRWPHSFTARYSVILGDALTLELDVTNTGQAEFTFEEALHTYLAVADVKGVTVEGLGGVDYVDKTDGMAVKTQGGKPIKVVEETDRVYLGTKGTVTVTDPGRRRKLVVAKENSDATVLWNPWIAKARAMADFGDTEWPQMLCVKTCNVNVHSVALRAGASHVMKAVVGTKPA